MAAEEMVSAKYVKNISALSWRVGLREAPFTFLTLSLSTLTFEEFLICSYLPFAKEKE